MGNVLCGGCGWITGFVNARKVKSLDNEARRLRDLYLNSNEREYLDESIACYRSALVLHPKGHPGRHMSLGNLAISLWTRFENIGQTGDLEESIRLERAALALCPEGHPDRSASLGNLAISLCSRFRQTGQTEDLEESISLQRAALALHPEGHPDRSALMGNLAISLRTRFRQFGQMEDLEESISLQRTALAFFPEGRPDRSASMGNLANSVLRRFEQNGQMEDLEESISLQRTALAFSPEGHPDRSVSLGNLATSVLTRVEQNGQREDLSESMRLYAWAAAHTFSSLVTRLDMAVRWSRAARLHSHSTTLCAYETALSLLERALTLSPSLRKQHDYLTSNRSHTTLALDAASYAIEKGDLKKAIEMLEQGRCLLWSQMRGFRTLLDDLAEVNKPLADKFKDANRRLETLSTYEPSLSSTAAQLSRHTSGQGQGNIFDNHLNLKRRLSDEQEKLITQIRDIPGFEDFLRTTPFEKLKPAAEDGPVVIINHCSYRCDALILLRDFPPAHAPLDTGFYRESFVFWESLLTARRGPLKSSSPGYSLTLAKVMQMLWDRVVSRVVEKLKELRVPDEAHVWWCPTSILSEFPFHAAGPFESADGGQKYFLDNYISSYTPTLKAPIDARRKALKQKLKFLIVAPETSPTGSLPSTEEEIKAICSFGMPTSNLINDQASRDAVVKALQGHTWVHFTCHGSMAEKPFDSSFILSDGRLTLHDIARTSMPNAEFAFLPACHTADQSSNFAASDEVLHLAAGMQFCGFRSVIGTMWQMADIDGPHMAREVYAIMSKKLEKGELRFKRSATALRAAVLESKAKLEEQRSTSVERWMDYVHIGA